MVLGDGMTSSFKVCRCPGRRRRADRISNATVCTFDTNTLPLAWVRRRNAVTTPEMSKWIATQSSPNPDTLHIPIIIKWNDNDMA